MGRNRNKSGAKKKNQSNSADAVSQVRRSLEKRQFKEALKLARVAVRKAPGAAIHQLLERATLERAAELQRGGLIQQCHDLLLPLAESAADADVRAALPELLMRAGVLDRFPAYRDVVSDETRETLRLEAFDRAVVSPEKAGSGSAPGIDAADREQASVVRQALEAVEQSRDDAAAELLRVIPRQSPGAEWRLFVRGLSAWYRHDSESASANWSRLSEHRPASRIAARLGAMLDGDETRDGGVNPYRAVEHAVLGASSLSSLSELRERMAAEDWDGMFRAWQQCRGAFRRTQPDVIPRITAAVVARLIRNEDYNELSRFRHKADALPIDPRWNRAFALVEEPDDIDRSETYWKQYLSDLEGVSFLTDEEQRVARGLVHARLGSNSSEYIMSLVECGCGADHSEEIDDEYERATEHFANSLTAYARNASVWQEFAALHDMVGQQAAAATTNLDMLQHFPDDLDALQSAGAHQLLHGDLVRGRECLVRAFRLRPLDNLLRRNAIAGHNGCARHFALAGNIDDARTELAAATALLRDQDRSDRCGVLARTAVIEYRARQYTAAEKAVDRALLCFTEPGPVFFRLTVECIRADLPRSRVRQFESQWKQELKRACRSETAGDMALLLSGLRRSAVKYPGMDRHSDEVLKYIRRAKRVQWESEDLRCVCQFLEQFDDDELFAKLVEKGRKKFSDDPWFQLMAGELEMNKDKFCSRPDFAVRCFTTVVELCEGSPDQEHTLMLAVARKQLSALEEFGQFRRKGRHPGGMPPLPEIFQTLRDEGLGDILDGLIDLDREDGESAEAGRSRASSRDRGW